MKIPPSFVDRQVRVLIVGAGGNGSQMLYGLAKLHSALIALGHPHGFQVTLADPDRVTASNVARQLFSPADIGHAKADILIHRVNMFYGLCWEAAVVKLGAKGFRQAHFDLVIGCVDTAASRRAIHKAIDRSWKCWWLDLGNSERTGQVVLGKMGRIINEARRKKSEKLELECRPPVVTELFPALMDATKKEDDTPSCSVAESLGRQDLFINQAVSTLALNLLWTWFRYGKLEHHGYFVNLEAGRVVPMPIDPEAWKRIRKSHKKKRPANNSRTPVRKRSKPSRRTRQ